MLKIEFDKLTCKKTFVESFKNGNEKWCILKKCSNCGGTGHIDYYNYHDNGVCYKCMGTGYEKEFVIVETEENYNKRLAREQKKADKLLKQKLEIVKKNLEEGFTKIESSFSLAEWFVPECDWSCYRLGYYKLEKETDKAVCFRLKINLETNNSLCVWFPKKAIIYKN